MKSVIFLVSGNGGNLKFIHYASKLLEIDLNIHHVIADRDCKALDFANGVGLQATKINYNTKSPDELDFILKDEVPSIVITNIHKILSQTSIFPHHQYINLHYSLLPAFKGLIGMETLKEAKKLNSPYIGATTHKVIEKVDSGPILQQGIFKVDWKTDVAHLYDTLFKVGSLVLLNTILGGEGRAQKNRRQINEEWVDFSDPFVFEWAVFDKLNIWNRLT